jgi:hypothetical protein
MQERVAIPSTGSLLGEAFDHWTNHQRQFWIVAGPGIAAFAILPIIEFLLSPRLYALGLDALLPLFWSGIRILLTTLVLYQWFKYALYDDWSQRRRSLLGQDRFPWHAFISGGFIIFLVAQSIFLRIVFSLWGQFLADRLPSVEERRGGMPLPWFAHVPIDSIGQIALAFVFGGFLLFLPARAADLPWSPWRAFREAAGIQTRLIAIAAFLEFVVIAGESMLNVLGILVMPQQAAWLGTASIIPFLSIRSLLASFIELLTLYVLMHTVSRLFVMKTGWKPGPITQPWTFEATTRE